MYMCLWDAGRKCTEIVAESKKETYFCYLPFNEELKFWRKAVHVDEFDGLPGLSRDV